MPIVRPPIPTAGSRTYPLRPNSTAAVLVPETDQHVVWCILPSPERVRRILVDRVLPLHGRTTTIAENGTAGIKYTRERCCHG